MFAPDDEESENNQNGSGKETLPSTCEEGDEVIKPLIKNKKLIH